MMMTVTATAARPVGSTTFDDLLPEGVRASSVRVDGAMVTVEFDADLGAVTVAAIRDRMTSRDDADQANRAMLRDAAAAGAINLAEMHLAYTLGDPIPAPVLPQT